MFRRKGKNFNPEKKVEKVNAISLIVLAKVFGVKVDELLFAISETYDGDSVFDTTPVVLIVGTDKYIDLSDGVKKQSAYAKGLKQNFYDCNVTFTEDKFIFSSSSANAEVSADRLTQIFGKAILIQKY